MANTITIPLKYKFLSVMLLVVLSALSIFLYTAAQTFTEDSDILPRYPDRGPDHWK